MDIGNVITQSIELVWKRKFLWLLGMLMGINSLVFNLIRPFLRSFLPSQWFEMEYWLNLAQSDNITPPDFSSLTSDTFGLYLLGSVLVLFFYVVVFWVIVTVAEGAIIGATFEDQRLRPLTFSTSLRLGFSYLKRFAAIDAAVFFPLFLWMLFMTIIGLIDTIAVGYMTLQTEAESSTVISVFVLGWLCVFALSCFIIPITLISIWYRTLAFRDAAILDHGVREAMRHTRQVIRQNFGDFLVMTVIIYGLSYVTGWLLSFLSLPILALTAVPLATGLSSISGILASGANLFITLLIALLRGILHAFTAVAWTIGYRQLTSNGS